MLSLNQLQLQRAAQLLALQNHAVFVQFQRVSANDLKALDVLELIHLNKQCVLRYLILQQLQIILP